MKERKPGELTTLETRAAAEEKLNKNLRYRQILAILDKLPEGKGYTAKEIAWLMKARGDIPTDERNFTAPRLTELGRKGIVEPIGKKTCAWTRRTVTVWGLCDKNEREESKWN